ncbi:cyclic pyranopterin monophosphate synthase MoaC [Blastopirellula sp. J2-11]|uniref:cyclic pyranopterin monophosphate synthase MoaC n=1 Tax=Blastopirellula sp. J2-11 TaxID=2943192 RepID=UPI0021CA1F53|nr:cyclic pyranopterin monophosphate synthase MoaC [Blastopirellula sp. J2-11]UUO04796.1 cyclic pyranopterin monophosphate synthase MoaC [Blastopirellula sp. J2-11]
MAGELTHFDDSGASRMVDVSAKPTTIRTAKAEASVVMAAATAARIAQRDLGKGDVLEVARLAGIMAAKRTGEWIPLCHPIPLEGVTIDFRFVDATTLVIEASTRTTGKTGVEMEALTAASAAALTVYDMCKSIDREMEIRAVRLLEKTGGRSGHFVRSADGDPADPASPRVR